MSELLEGETLRDRLRSGALPSRKAIDYARQIASGLAAAHEKGIVHRDLKPENIFITNDGRAKILDFGLAKFTRPEVDNSGEAPTQQIATDAGTVMGTVGYMAPEQVRGKAADARADIFAFGAILYEMLSGKRAFHGDSPVDTMSAILKEDPPELSETNRNVSPALERIVRHCLEKNPAERFQSARDVAFNLEALTDISTSSRSGAQAVRLEEESAKARRWLMPVLGGLLLLASWAGIYRVGAARDGGESDFSRGHFPQRNDLGRALCSGRADDYLRRGVGRVAAGNFLDSIRQHRLADVWACRRRRFFPSLRRERWRSACIRRRLRTSRRPELWRG